MGNELNPTIRKSLKKEIEDNLFTSGYNWNKTEVAKKYETSTNTVYAIINEIQDNAKHKDYHLMQLLRLEKQRQLTLEELNEQRTKGKSRLNSLRELRETEREITALRLKAGLMDNNEIIHIESKNENKNEISLIDMGKILEREVQGIQTAEDKPKVKLEDGTK